MFISFFISFNMTKEQILELIPLIEVQICGILIERNICTYIQKPKETRKEFYNRFTNLKLSPKYSKEEELITYEQVQELRNMYPKGSDRKGTVQVIKDKATRFLIENPDATFDDIKKVMEFYISESVYTNGMTMLFNLNNIFYKQDGGSTKSPMENLFHKYSDRLEKSNNFEVEDEEEV